MSLTRLTGVACSSEYVLLNEEVLQEEESLHGETVLADTDRIVFLHRGLQLVQLTCRQRAFEALALR